MIGVCPVAGCSGVLAEPFGLGDRARPPGVVGQQLAQLRLEIGIGHGRVEFALQLQQRREQRLRYESAAKPVEMAACIGQGATGGLRQLRGHGGLP